MADQSLFKEKSPAVLEGLRDILQEKFPGLGLEIFFVPFGEGGRAHLTRAEGKKVIPISTASTSNLERPIKDIVHGLWGCLAMRGEDEIRHIRRASTKSVK